MLYKEPVVNTPFIEQIVQYTEAPVCLSNDFIPHYKTEKTIWVLFSEQAPLWQFIHTSTAAQQILATGGS